MNFKSKTDLIKNPFVSVIIPAINVKNWQNVIKNLQSKKIFVPELGKSIKLKVSTKAIKTIDRYGLLPYLKKKGLSLSDIV